MKVRVDVFTSEGKHVSGSTRVASGKAHAVQEMAAIYEEAYGPSAQNFCFTAFPAEAITDKEWQEELECGRLATRARPLDEWESDDYND